MNHFRAYKAAPLAVTQFLQAPRLCACTVVEGLPLCCVDVRSTIAAVHEREELACYDLRDLGFGALTGVPALRLGADVVVVAMPDAATQDTAMKDVATPDAVTQNTAQALVLLAGGGLELCPQLEAVGCSRLSSDELSVYQNTACEQWRKLSDVAHIVASYLRCHPKIAEVRWPGLTTDPSYKLASQIFEAGFGARIDWQLKGCEDWHSFYAQLEDWASQVLEFEHMLTIN